jgi:TonB-linked SusC/RagA family outer membrane protein
VTGRVLTVAGTPIVNADVQVRGTALHAHSGEDGRYVIGGVPAGVQVLVARHIGYRSGGASISTDRDTVDFKLEQDVLELESVVVTGTATSVSSQNAANSVAVVSAEQLTRAPTPTIENALQGKMPGVTITTNSGAPGGGAQVQIRGVASINSNASPLWVVDGVLVNNDETRVGSNSLTQAGGGIQNSQDQAANRIADLNPEDIESIQVLKGPAAGAIYGSKGASGVILVTTKRGLVGRASVHATQRFGQFSISKKLGSRCFGSGAEVVAAGYDSTGFGAATNKCHDYESEFYSGNGPSYESDLSVTGGSGGTTYFLSGRAKRDNAIQRNTYFQDQSLVANVGQAIGSRVTAHVNGEFIHSLTDRGISGNDNSPVVSPVDIISSTPSFFDMKTKVNGLYQPNPFLGEGTNIFQTADLVKSPADVYRSIVSLNTDWSAYVSARQTFDVTLVGGLDAFQFYSKIYSPPEVFYESADGLAGTLVTNKTNTVNANLNLSGRHMLQGATGSATTSFGLRQERRQSDALFNQAKNLPSNVTDIQYGIVQTPQETQVLVKDLGYYLQEELLGVSDRLLLTAAINAERSSVNGDDRKFYTYPKLAASYRVPFLPAHVDALKLRAAWGKAGVQPSFGAKYTTLAYSVYGSSPALRTSTVLGNSSLKPETSTELEGGVDAQFLDGRVSFEGTLFQRNVDDLILAIAQASTTGFTTKNANGGAIKNTGTELGVSLIPVQNARATWISRTTFATVHGLFTRMDAPGFYCGQAFSLRYGETYCAAGHSTTSMQVDDGFDTTSVSPLVRVRHIKEVDYSPKFQMGFSNDVTVGRFRFSGLLDWRKGGYAVNLTNNYFDGSGLLADTALANARLTKFGQGYGVYLEKATFLKLREISVSYELPDNLSRFMKMAGGHSTRVEISGRNLKTWTPYTGYDPEVSNFGNQNIRGNQDVTPFPPSRSIFFSLSTTL